jgi:LAS superfamily LD-carboxypeptidase LdcB
MNEIFDADVLKTFPAAFETLKAHKLLSPKMTFAELQSAMDGRQKDIVARILKLDPKDYGVNTPYAGDLEDVPADLVLVRGQKYRADGEEKTLGDKYAPRPVYDAFMRMNAAFMADYPARRLLIDACYRSPAYQVVVFINWLTGTYGGDIGKTIRHASPPAYSQHTIASKAAVDVRTVDGSPSEINPEDFRDTPEYAWLCRHAEDFDFYESWPQDNPFGMRAEPWHWQYRKV